MSDETDHLQLDAKTLNKFSRQNAALGADTTAKLIRMRVLIVGMRGVGIETAKNLALQGVGAITVVDPHPVEAKDLGVNFFLHEEDIAKNLDRGRAVVPRVQELNTLCKVRSEKELTDELIQQHSALVLTHLLPMAELNRLNELCRARRISFFLAVTGGVSTSVFVDHGPNHVVTDPNGERPIQKLIVDITAIGGSGKAGEEDELLVRYDHPSGQLPESIMDGNFEITEVNGLENVDGKIYAVTHSESDPVKTVRIKCSPPRGSYVSGGLLTEKKLPTPHPMLTLAEKIKNPGSMWALPPTLVSTDLLNFGWEYQQHVSLWALDLFLEEHKRLPVSVDDAEAVVQFAKALIAKEDIVIEDFVVDEEYVKRYATHSSFELQPMSAFTGGVLAQEVVKCSGKFTPIPGFLHFSAFEALPDEKPSEEDREPRGHRNDELASVYGWPFVEALGRLRYFMVGCGALGCEFLKNFALNGIFCGPGGKLTVTDPDRIELSNLTRQFLFREHNVGHPKSKAASDMARVMNRDFTIEPLEQFVGPKSEGIFNDDFWDQLDGVCNALDNMEARNYVDSQCVRYERSLLESGTMGPSGNVDTICPFKTKTYHEGGVAAEGGGVPMCTLRNFPQITDHCIEWSRDQFEFLFTKLVKYCEQYLADPESFEKEISSLSETSQIIFITRSVTSMVKAISKPSIGGCAQLAFDLFHFLFRDKILDLQTTFPADKRIIGKNGVDKGPFWGEKKRFPQVAVFDPADESHTSFLLSATCLFGVAIGHLSPKQENDDHWLKDYRSPQFITGVASGLNFPEYVFCPVSTEDDEPDASHPVASINKESLIAGLFQDLRSAASSVESTPTFTVADFEKDDDFNFHIAFITAAANLRCDNYSIARTNFHSCKVIAGKIIAAIATTTAAVCGLVILELFKLQLKKPTDAYMNRQIGLAINGFTSFTADAPRQFVTYTETTQPSPDDPNIPPDAFNENGVLREEFAIKVTRRAYPEKHTVWDKIVCSASLTLREFASWLENEHKLKMNSWDFIIGYKQVVDEDGRKAGRAGVSSPVYPPKPVLDSSLLPSLDLTLAQATQALMRTPAAKPVQQYIGLWRESKAKGALPPPPSSDDFSINDSTTIREILVHMERLGAKAEEEKKVEARAVTGVAARKFWVVPADETPSCEDLESGDEIHNLASIKFLLA